MKYLKWITLTLLIGIPMYTLAAPTTNYFLNIAPTIANTYNNGTIALPWLNFYTKFATTTQLTVSGQTSGCAQFDSTGFLTSVGTNCGSGSGGENVWTDIANSYIKPTTTIGMIVSASSTITGLTINANSTTTGNVYIVGNVGVGTTTNGTSGKLDVSGFINTDQFSGYRIDGRTVLTASSTNGNVFGGIQAGFSFLTNIVTIAGNTAFGHQALYTTTNAIHNTAIGYQTLYSINDVTGIENTAVGYLAGQLTTTGYRNTFVGESSGVTNTTGYRNAGFGSRSLFSNTTGFDNTGVGTFALYGQQTGTANVALGTAAGGGNFSNYSANGGTYIGFQAGDAVQSAANFNTLVGYGAGGLITTGFDNTIIGADLNQTTLNLTTGHDNIALGVGVAFPSNSVNNQLFIGGLIFGTLPATTSSFVLPTSGSIGIGTSSPYAKFAIHTNNGDTATTLFAIASSTVAATTTLFSVSNTGLITTSLATGCVSATAGVLSVGAACGTGGTFPFTPTTNFGATANATNTAIWFQAGLQASSTFNGQNISIDKFSTYQINGVNFAYSSSTNADTFVGFQALPKATTSATFDGSTAVGYQALYYATTSPSNTAVGMYALRGAVTTQQFSSTGKNTAVGQFALASTTSGNNNTAVGANAGRFTGANNANTYIGADAGLNATGGSNVVVGASSMNGTTPNIIASSNVFVGTSIATAASFSGAQNTCVGTGCLNVITTGRSNVAMGYNTLVNLTTGSDNIVIGDVQNSGGSHLTTGNGNLLMGYNIVPTTTSANLFLNVGNYIFGNLPATSTATSLNLPTQGTFSIGSTSPFSKFSIHTNNGDTAATLFAIGSSTASATTTLFSISNTGTITTVLSSGCISSASGVLTAGAACGSVTSITAGLGLNGGAITTSGTINLISYLATSSAETAGQLAYWTSTNGTPATLGKVATGTVSAGSSAITVTAGRSAIGGALAIDCATASGSQAGCLSSTDWTTFNSKQATIAATWPILLSGATLSFGGLSTSSAAVVGNIPYYSGVNTFANVATGTISATLGLTLDSSVRSAVGGALAISVATSSLYTGTVGQNTYFSGTNALIGTSTIFTSTGSLVGIASTTPWGQLSVDTRKTTSAIPSFVVGSSTATNFIIAGDSGHVGLGTTSPWNTFTLHTQEGGDFSIGSWSLSAAYTGVWLNGSHDPGDYNLLSAAGDKNLYLNRPTGQTMNFRRNNVDDMVIGTGGSITMPNTTTSGSSQTGFWCYDGSATLIRDTVTCLVSALKFKKNINNLSDDVALRAVLQMQPVTYYEKDPLGPDVAGEQVGFIADYAKDIVPDLITHDNTGAIHGFNYEQFTAYLNGAIRAQQKQIDGLKVGTVKQDRTEENIQWLVIFLLLSWIIKLEFTKKV